MTAIIWDPVGELLTPEAKEKITKENYERIFNKARKDFRAREAANNKQPRQPIQWSPASGYALPKM